jgi:hypothetical protein
MSATPPTGAAVPARHIQDLIKSTSARFTGKKRGNDRKVRRHSCDIDDVRAQVFRPIGDGTTAGALRWSRQPKSSIWFTRSWARAAR